MMKRLMLTAGLIGAVAAAPATAVTVVATQNAFAAPALTGAGNVFTFNSGSTTTEVQNFQTAGFTVSSTGSASVESFSVANDRQMPQPGDNSPFAVVRANSSVDFFKNTAFESISLYLGSLDAYNSISLLSRTGAVISGQTYTGAQLAQFAVPVGTTNGTTSYRITFTRQAGDAAIGGLRISSSGNSAEFDNLVFAVPEPSTWALMLAGFGLVGFAMRTRRRRTDVVFG